MIFIYTYKRYKADVEMTKAAVRISCRFCLSLQQSTRNYYFIEQ